MYPFKTSRKRDDDFGETIVISDFLRAEEKEELDADTQAKADRKVGEKRKWDDNDTTSNIPSKGRVNATKRAKTSQAQDDIDAAIAKATGEALSGTKVAQAPASDSEDSEYDDDEAGDKAQKKSS